MRLIAVFGEHIVSNGEADVRPDGATGAGRNQILSRGLRMIEQWWSRLAWRPRQGGRRDVIIRRFNVGMTDVKAFAWSERNLGRIR
jgi:hypothetical protein